MTAATEEGWKVLGHTEYLLKKNHPYTSFIHWTWCSSIGLLEGTEGKLCPCHRKSLILEYQESVTKSIDLGKSREILNRWNFHWIGQECAVARRSTWLSHVTLQNLVCHQPHQSLRTPCSSYFSSNRVLSLVTGFTLLVYPVWPRWCLLLVPVRKRVLTCSPSSIRRRSPWWQYWKD